MKACPDTDALVTAGAALSWDFPDALRHLQTCADCRARLDVLQATRTALAETEPVAVATVARIAAAIADEAGEERARHRKRERLAYALEALLAGVTAPLVLVSSGIELGSAAGALTFALGAAFLIFGRSVRAYAA